MVLERDLAYVNDQELWQDQDRFRLVLENLHDYAVIMADSAGDISYWNSGARNLFGYAPDEAIGRPLADLFGQHERARGAAEREMENAARNGNADNECMMARKDGTEFMASGSLSGIFGKEHRLLGYVKVLRDQTDRQKLQEELQSYRARLEFAQSVSRIGTFEWDIETNAEIWSEALYHIYDIPTGKIIGNYHDWLQLVHPDDVARVEAAFAESIHYRKDLSIENRILVRNGFRWVDCRGRAVYDERGKPLRMIGLQVDITERKEAEQALQRANRDLEQFASIASHDLQEPLRTVSSYLTLLEREAALGDKAKQYLSRAVDGAKRMQSLVRSLLEMARIERGDLFIELVDLNDVLREVLENLGQRIQEANATIKIDELPSIYAHRDHMVRLWQNIISNSIKYRKPDVKAAIHVHASRRNQLEWLFTISDNGIGIPREHHHDIFEMFRRLHGHDEYSGFGIGLGVCKKIVERHHGSIWIDSEPERGTTVLFTLPAHD
jgi:PAS domain S-box-containing protein